MFSLAQTSAKSSPRPRARRHRGLTLVELAAATGVLAIAALSLMSVLLRTVQLEQLNRERTWAREECRRQMERVIAAPFSSVPRYGSDPTLNAFDVGFDVNGAGAPERLRPPPGEARVGAIVVEGPGVTGSGGTATGDATCYRVVVTARWRQTTGRGGLAAGDVGTYRLVANVSDR